MCRIDIEQLTGHRPGNHIYAIALIFQWCPLLSTVANKIIKDLRHKCVDFCITFLGYATQRLFRLDISPRNQLVGTVAYDLARTFASCLKVELQADGPCAHLERLISTSGAACQTYRSVRQIECFPVPVKNL